MTRGIDENIPEWIRKYPRPVSSLPVGAARSGEMGQPDARVAQSAEAAQATSSREQRQVLHLASNENPLGPSPRAIEAARAALCEAHRYAPGSDLRLRKALAARLRVAVESVMLGAGSSELIEMAAKLVLEPGDVGVTSASSFPLYASSIRLAGAELVETPLRGWSIDLEAIAREVEARRELVKIVYLASPNNPTGTLFTADEFEALMARVPGDVLVVLDEAYFEYVERENYSRAAEWVKRHENLLVLRTFAKVHGLAGLRIGYGFGAAALMGQMEKVRVPFNTSVVAETAALAAMDDVEHVRRSVETNRVGMAQLREGFEKLGLELAPCFGNFVAVELPVEAQGVADWMAGEGVIVRPLGVLGLPKAIRATVSRASDNERFLKALEGALRAGGR